MKLFRLYNNPVVRWWWGIDRPVFLLVTVLLVIGGIVMITASNAVSRTYEVDAYYFARRQLMFLLASLPVLVVASTLSLKGIRYGGFLLFMACLVGVMMTLLIGSDVKGAHRWIELAGFSLQPTEFLKPGFIIVTAALLATRQREERLRHFFVSLALLVLLGAQVLLQPDFGMFLILSAVWFVQVFMAGVPLRMLAPLVCVGLVIVSGGYMLMPHVRSRVDRFLDPAGGDSYQVDQAREAFLSGGLLGRGPGEGVVKYTLPDAHTDFVFAVIGEEFGILTCLLLLGVYGMIVFRGFSLVLDHKDRFVYLAGAGLLVLLSFQVLVNMGVVLNVLPTTGMTLPFISYGGSSTLSMALSMGILFALMRKGRGHVRR